MKIIGLVTWVSIQILNDQILIIALKAKLSFAVWLQPTEKYFSNGRNYSVLSPILIENKTK